MPTHTLTPALYGFDKDPKYVEIESDLFDGAGPYDPTEENLTCYLQVDFAYQNDADYSSLVKFNSPYSRWNKKTEFDLSHLFPLYIQPPTAASILSGGTGAADTHSGRFRFKYADMFGTPPTVPVSFTSVSPFYVIRGSSMYWNGFGDAAAINFMLHSWLNRNGRLLAREVRKEQPEYIYVFKTAGGSFTVNVTFFYTDGTDDAVTKGPIVVEDNSVAWVAVGWNQLDLDADVDDAKDLMYYYITIDDVDGGMRYQLDDHTTEYDQYFLFDNGVGGLDTLRCSGKTIFGASGTRQIFDRTRARGTNFQTGLVGINNATASEEWQMNTGYFHEDWCRHLAQLLTGDIWYIDRARNRFLKCTITNNSLRLVDKEDDPTMQYVEFTVKFHETPSINSYLL